MKKRQDQSTEIKGTQMHARTYVDPSGREKPVIIVEGANRGVSLDTNREAVAKELSARVGKTPDQVIYLEQAADGSMEQTHFEKGHLQTVIPDAYDLTPTEAERAAEQGEIPSHTVQHYTMETHSVSRHKMEERVGEPLETREVRQNQEFAQMTGPQTNRAQELELER